MTTLLKHLDYKRSHRALARPSHDHDEILQTLCPSSPKHCWPRSDECPAQAWQVIASTEPSGERPVRSRRCSSGIGVGPWSPFGCCKLYRAAGRIERRTRCNQDIPSGTPGRSLARDILHQNNTLEKEGLRSTCSV